MSPRRRLIAVAAICVAVIALLVAVSSSDASESSPGAVRPLADVSGAQRLSDRLPVNYVDPWTALAPAVADYKLQRVTEFVTYTEAVEREQRRAAERERQRREAAEAQQEALRSKSSSAVVRSSGSGVWYDLAGCEAGGNWAANTGNGYYGGLQFSLGTWEAYGGTGYPHQASPGTQIAIAENLLAAEGDYGAWPHCSEELGLPNGN